MKIILHSSNVGDLFIRQAAATDDMLALSDMAWQAARMQPGAEPTTQAFWLSKLNYAMSAGLVVVLVKTTPTANGVHESLVGVGVGIHNPKEGALELFGAFAYWDEATTVPAMLTAMRDEAKRHGLRFVKRVVRVSYDDV